MLRRSALSFNTKPVANRGYDPLGRRRHFQLHDITSREDLKHARRIVIKAGTTTTTESDGYPSLRRVTSIIEQIAMLRRQNKEIVFVASGAVGYGRCVQRRQRILMSSALERMYDVNDKLYESGSGKNTLAAIGQSAMMNLYSALFQQLDTPIGQLLLTPNDFLSQDRTSNVINTIGGFMDNGVVPIVNENDAVTFDMKNLPNKPFTDNDGLACLVGSHIGADLIIFLTDVDGLYDKSPDEPDAKFIPTWIPQDVKFGEKSSMGRGGMQSKVDNAMMAIKLGIPAACICSGQRHGTITNVLEGACEGTLFVQKPELLVEPTAAQLKKMLGIVEGRSAMKGVKSEPIETKPATPEAEKSEAEVQVSEDIRKQAAAAREGSRSMLALGSAERSHVINCVADALQAKTDAILEANAVDVDRETKAGKLAAPLLARLKLTKDKMKVLISGVRSLASSEEPVGKVLGKMQMAEGAMLRQETTPIGVVTVIFESRPDSLVQIASLTLRSCNGLLLKGGKEAVRSNAILHRTIVDAVHEATGGRVPRGVIGLIESRSQIAEILKLNKDIDLIIPRGSNQLVQSIQNGTRIPVLGHADGICHTYVDASCLNLEKAADIIVDAKLQYPAACNATETLLLDSAIPERDISSLLKTLESKGIKMLGGPAAREKFPGLLPDACESFSVEYGDNQMTVELVDGVMAAAKHINAYGSHHTDAILSHDHAICKQFLNAVDSACVFQNTSTRMADGYRFGLGAEVGISTSRIHARGPVGVEGLLSMKWVLESPSVEENITATAFSSGEKEFLHKKLPLDTKF